MGIRVAINGFGRIGRSVARVIAALPGDELELVAVNDLAAPATLAYLLEFDSVHGRANREVALDGATIQLGRHRIRAHSERDPAALPWRDERVDVVLECTGVFRDREGAGRHLTAGAGHVVISAPPHGEVDGVFVLGVNDAGLDPTRHRIVSNASCTTNCVAPQLRVLARSFGVEKAHMLTVHAYTNDQSIVDEPHATDPRRGRTAGVSMIPTSSGVNRALFEVMPELRGRFHASSVRVPTPDVSMTCLSVLLGRTTSAEEVNDAMRAAASGPLAGILSVEDRPLVSVDYTGCPYSAVIDARLTTVVDGNLLELSAWYDNEWGFSNRMVDLARRLSGA